MKALILSAGFGKRLKPITNKLPKCLVKIGKKTLLEIWLEKLYNLGVKSFLINTHYKSNLVEKFVSESKFKKRIKLVKEKKILGTAGTLAKNIDFFKNSGGFVLHCDNFSKFSVKRFLKKHNSRPKKTLITLLSFNTTKPENSGIIKKNKKGIVNKIYEKKKKNYGKKANGAFYFFSKKSLEMISKYKNPPKDIVKDILMKNLNKIYCVHTNAFFIDVGDLKSLKIARKFNNIL